MATDETYNGWTNRETWAVALHINNDQGWQESVHDAIREYVAGAVEMEASPLAHTAGEIVRENVEETLSPWDGERGDGEAISLSHGQWLALQDIGSLWRVDWDEIGASFLADVADHIR